MSVEATIAELVADALGLEPSEVGLDATSESLAEWDSLRHLDVVLAVEQRFGIALTPEDIARGRSVRLLAALVRDRGRGG